jgi:hypothetical protein
MPATLLAQAGKVFEARFLQRKKVLDRRRPEWITIDKTRSQHNEAGLAPKWKTTERSWR